MVELPLPSALYYSRASLTPAGLLPQKQYYPPTNPLPENDYLDEMLTPRQLNQHCRTRRQHSLQHNAFVADNTILFIMMAVNFVKDRRIRLEIVEHQMVMIH